MKKTKQTKSKLPEVTLTPVQKLEKYLLENKLSVGVQAVHDQMWRKRIVLFVCKVLKVNIVPYVYPVIKQ
jgi:hypothetical protein